MTERRVDNRAAGAPATQSGAADVALFGAVPIAFAGTPASGKVTAFHIAGAPTGIADAGRIGSHGDHEGASTTANAPQTVVGPLVQPTGALSLHAPVISLAGAGAAVSGTDGPVSAPPGSHVATFVPANTAHVTADLVASHGSTPSTTAHLGDSPVQAQAPAAIGVDDAIASVRATAASLHDAITSLADRLQTDATVAAGQTVAAVEADLRHVHDQVGAVVSHVGDLGATVSDHVAGAVGNLAADTSADVGRTVAATVDVVDGATKHAATLVEHAAQTAAPAIHDAGSAAVETVGHVAAAATGALSAVTDTLSHTDHLQDVGGSDPAGGVATLVGMVSAADAFDLHDTSVAQDLAPALGAFGSADFLAEVAPAEALLGTHNQHEHVLSGVADSLHDGLFGHG